MILSITWKKTCLELHDRVRHPRVVAEDPDPALADAFVLLPDDEGEDAVWVVVWEAAQT